MRAILATLLLFVVPFSGCMGDDAPDVTISWITRPTDVDAGEEMEVVWKLEGEPATIDHTGLHYGPESVPDADSAEPSDYPEAAGVTEPASVPGTYTADVYIDEPGTYFLRAHAATKDGHVWTDEVRVVVRAGSIVELPFEVVIMDWPEETTAGEEMLVKWRLDGVPGEATHTGFHYGSDPVADPSTPADYPDKAGVREPAAVPASYTARFTIAEPGTVYGRAHALYDGDHYWSEEVRMVVVAPAMEEEPPLPAEEHAVAMGDVTGPPFAFDPDPVTVHAGDSVNWTSAGQLAHTVTFEDEALGDSGQVEAGASHLLAIPADLAPGEYPYVCTNHEAAGMTGTLVVEAAS